MSRRNTEIEQEMTSILTGNPDAIGKISTSETGNSQTLLSSGLELQPVTIDARGLEPSRLKAGVAFNLIALHAMRNKQGSDPQIDQARIDEARIQVAMHLANDPHLLRNMPDSSKSYKIVHRREDSLK